jgi:hypothetical protein
MNRFGCGRVLIGYHCVRRRDLVASGTPVGYITWAPHNMRLLYNDRSWQVLFSSYPEPDPEIVGLYNHKKGMKE